MKIEKYRNNGAKIIFFAKKSLIRNHQENRHFLAFMCLIVMTTYFLGCKTEDEISKQFPPAHPCPGLPVVNFGGEDYPTVEIGSQCWLAKNLNIGSLIVADTEMQNNDEIEKYCYLNNPSYCLIYGGLYQWDEMMQYSNAECSTGICPEGWHIPTESEWNELLIYIDNDMRRIKDYRDQHWEMNSSDSTLVLGFNALPCGYFYHHLIEFSGRYKYAQYWSKTESDTSSAISFRLFSPGWYGETFYQSNKLNAASVRCIKDQE